MAYVLTHLQVQNTYGNKPVWIERRGTNYVFLALYDGLEKLDGVEMEYFLCNTISNYFRLETYNLTWRCWSAAPTPEEMQAAPWRPKENG